MKVLIDSLNAQEQMQVAFHPAFPEVIYEANSHNIGYKLYQPNESHGVIANVVVPMDAFHTDASGSLKFRDGAYSALIADLAGWLKLSAEQQSKKKVVQLMIY